MKKKIAVISNGWSYEFFSHAVEGMKECAKQEDFDIFVFLCFANYSVQLDLMQGELNVYKLCNMKDYDGVIVFSNWLNSDATAIALCKSAKDQGVPVISVGMEIPGIPCVKVDGITGMRKLVTHLVEDHGVKDVVFVGGTPDHEESNERLAVTRKVLKEHGLSLTKRDVCYGRWSNRRTIDAVHGAIEKRGGLPDAFVCANDVMALAAATELGHMGYELPRDVIVTGFDHTVDGQIFYPALTTVKQNYQEVGYRCCEALFKILREGKCAAKQLIPTQLVIGESCGCHGTKEVQSLRKSYCRHFFQKTSDASFMEQAERNMRQRISEVSSYAELKTSLQSHFAENHAFEGENLHLILHADYYDNVMASEQELNQKKTRSKLEVVVSLKNGELQKIDRVTRSMLIPGYEKTEGEQHVYYFLPLHFQQYNYGYVVLADDPYIMRENLLYSYMEKLQQALKLLRTNLRLDSLNRNLSMLYDKDPMTGLFNRFGYENKAIPMYQDSVRKQTTMMVMFVDINFMKRINDQFGHIHGDAAIRTVADSIKANVKENWIAVRFGGDEFLVIAPDCGEEEAEDVKESIMEYLEHKNHDGTQPYQISTSCGYVITDPASGDPLQEYIREADRLMYEIKREVHAMDEAEQARLEAKRKLQEINSKSRLHESN